MKVITAEEGKVFAYKEGEEEIVLGSVLYLGVNDDGSRYYQVEKKEQGE